MSRGGASGNSPPLLGKVRERVKREIQCTRKQPRLLAYVDEESNRVEASTINSRMDAILALGVHLGKRDWPRCTRDDVIHTIANHVSRQGAHFGRTQGGPLAKSTKYQWSIFIRQFLKWVLQTDETPSQCKRLPFRKVDAMAGRIKELALSPEEVRQLLGGATNSRDRCLIIEAVEGGWRASEMAALRLDYTEKRKHGYWHELPPDEPLLKTGPREVAVAIIAGVRLVDEWLADHPRKGGSKPPFFVTLSNRSYGKRMTGASIAAAIARCARRAGMRHVHAHMLRHTSATLKVAKGMKPEAIRMTHGWKDLSMLSYYTHAKPHFEAMVLEVHGLKPDEPELLDIVGARPCLLCGAKLGVADDECLECGIPASAAMAKAAARRKQQGAVEFVALDLARSLGWKPSANEAAFDEAVEYLRTACGHVAGEDEFTRWCLREWAKRCT